MRGTIPPTPSRSSPEGFLVALIALVFAGCAGGTAIPPPAASGGASAAPSTAAPPASPPASSAAPTSTFPLEVTDDEGAAVRLEEPPERVVSLTPAVTETLFAIDAGDRVVGGTDFDDHPPEAVQVPDVASFAAVDVEAIVGLEPDLVIAGGNNFNDPAAIERLRELDIPVLVVYAPDVDTVLTDVELIGRAVGEEPAARDLSASLRAELDQVAAATRNVERPRVFYELDASTEIYGPADDSFIAEMVELAGGDPVTTGSTTAFAIPLERLVEADPEVIVLGDANYGVTPEAVQARPGWTGISAVRSGAIRPVNDIIVTRPGPRIGQGLRELALAIHPDLDLPAASPALSGDASPSPPAGASASP